MKAKPVVPRSLAGRYVDEAIDHWLADGGANAARGFIEALERAFLHVGRHPATGSPRYAQELNLPGLRFWPLKRLPHLVFYVERDDHIDVWRVLDGRRDVPTWMQIPEER